MTDDPDIQPILPKSAFKFVQQVIGCLSFYARAIDCTMLTALGTIATSQQHCTQSTKDAITQLLNYAATYPDAKVRYYKSDMILQVNSDASYLSESKARSRDSNYFYLSNAAKPTETSKPNGPLYVVWTILKMVVGSASEAKTAAAYNAGQKGCPIITTLQELGHQQPTTGTPIKVDNQVAEGIVNNTVKQKRSKAIDMRLYWLQDRTKQQQYAVYWNPGEGNTKPTTSPNTTHPNTTSK